tara:strand:- start:64 stop:381 length:318 start_codon:yes stop_codon:yes gene_type:complete
MKDLIKYAKRLKALGLKSDMNLNVHFIPDNDFMFLAANPAARKVVLIAINQLTQDKKDLRAYFINLRRWDWAEKEGFTEKDLLGKLGNQVFKEIELNEIIETLLQ